MCAVLTDACCLTGALATHYQLLDLSTASCCMLGYRVYALTSSRRQVNSLPPPCWVQPWSLQHNLVVCRTQKRVYQTGVACRFHWIRTLNSSLSFRLQMREVVWEPLICCLCVVEGKYLKDLWSSKGLWSTSSSQSGESSNVLKKIPTPKMSHSVAYKRAATH